jgi:hypothetical protein
MMEMKRGQRKMEILVIRHGQSVADIEGRMEGKADLPITELGEKIIVICIILYCNIYRFINFGGIIVEL